MRRSVPPPAREGAIGFWAAAEKPPRCPWCGTGDLFGIALRWGHEEVRQAAYCAGVYDRERRRFLRRGCGYWQGSAATRTVGAGPLRSEPQQRADATGGAQLVGGGPAHVLEPPT